MDDCYSVTAKGPFVECQMARELNYIESMEQHILIPDDQEIEHI